MFTSLGVENGVAILEVSGEVDIAVAESLVEEAVACLGQPGATALRIDLADVGFLDSSGLGALVKVRNHAHAEGKDLVLAGVSGSVMKVFAITGLSEVMTFDPAVDG